MQGLLKQNNGSTSNLFTFKSFQNQGVQLHVNCKCVEENYCLHFQENGCKRTELLIGLSQRVRKPGDGTEKKIEKRESTKRTKKFLNTTFIQSTFIKILIRETFSKDSIVLQLSIKLMIWNLKFKF